MAADLNFRDGMDDPYDLILAMFALAVTAIMPVAGELYLARGPEHAAGPRSDIIDPVNA